ncbi:Trk family potassium uptake protein [candidate division WOR-3 bacterium]|nr:Trk family potassium uptake protein [candidate division WOR-3 bacterium]
MKEKFFEKACELPLPVSFRIYVKKHLTPNRALLTGFIFLIFLGSVLLSLPFSYTGDSPSPVNCIFTSTSALCVTGLIVEDTAVKWTLFGKTIILLLIQTGALGYMTFASFLIISLGGKVTVYPRLIMKESFASQNIYGLGRFAKRVIAMTFFFELIGAFFLSFAFVPKFGFARGFGHAIFNSISAFCNAGFSTFSDSLVSFRTDPVVVTTVSTLVILGGIGFVVLLDLKKYCGLKIKNIFSKYPTGPKPILIPYSKMILIAYAILIVFPFFFFWFNEYALRADISFAEKIYSSFFQAVTPRTAGFNTADFNIFTNASLIVVIVLMFIGTGSGSTGGGVKISTVALALSTLVATLQGREKISILKRSVPPAQIFRAFSLITLSILWIILIFVLIQLFSDGYEIERIIYKLVFEIVSAFGTVGLSLGSKTNPAHSFSSDLPSIGKLLLVSTMIMGRLGPLTFGAALVKRTKSKKINYVKGFMPIG